MVRAEGKDTKKPHLSNPTLSFVKLTLPLPNGEWGA